MKQTAIQHAIVMVKSRIESIDETLMGKHTIHHLQQVERGLYELLETEKEQKGYTEKQAKQIWKAGQEYWKTSGSSITFEELIETYGKDA
jgi:hypothetical protein